MLPNILYGTVWKEDRTREQVQLALKQGFRGIDTANQRKHYHEAGVGEAIRDAIDKGLVTREELFLQTEYTFRGGQDHRLREACSRRVSQDGNSERIEVLADQEKQSL